MSNENSDCNGKNIKNSKSSKNSKNKDTDDIMRICVACQSKLSQGYTIKQIRKIQENQTKHLKRRHLSVKFDYDVKHGYNKNYYSIQTSKSMGNVIYNNHNNHNHNHNNHNNHNNRNNRYIINNNNVNVNHSDHGNGNGNEFNLNKGRSQSMDQSHLHLHSHLHSHSHSHSQARGARQASDSIESSPSLSSCSGGSSKSPDKRHKVSSVWGFRSLKSLFNSKNSSMVESRQAAAKEKQDSQKQSGGTANQTAHHNDCQTQKTKKKKHKNEHSDHHQSMQNTPNIDKNTNRNDFEGKTTVCPTLYDICCTHKIKSENNNNNNNNNNSSTKDKNKNKNNNNNKKNDKNTEFIGNLSSQGMNIYITVYI